jgi:hypothetical protein
MTALDEPKGALPQFVLTIDHGGEASNIADFAITLANFVAMFGSVSAFKDQQSMAIIGAMKCGRGPQRTVFRATKRILSPLRFGDSLEAPWLGVFVPSFATVWVHVAVAAVLLMSVSRLKTKRVVQALARVHFPSASLFVAQLLHIGVVFYSIDLLKVASSLLWLLLAAWGLAYATMLMGCILFWSFHDDLLRFAEYGPSDFVRVPPALKAVVPFGRWAPRKPMAMARWVIGEFRFIRFAAYEYAVGYLMALLASYLPDSFDACRIQYGLMGVLFSVCSLVMIVRRPFRSHFCNVASAVSNAFLAVFMVCATTLISDPFGPGYTATNLVRWLMTGLTLLRGVVGVAIAYLEYQLVSARLREVEEERRRQAREVRNVGAEDFQMSPAPAAPPVRVPTGARGDDGEPTFYMGDATDAAVLQEPSLDSPLLVKPRAMRRIDSVVDPANRSAMAVAQIIGSDSPSAVGGNAAAVVPLRTLMLSQSINAADISPIALRPATAARLGGGGGGVAEQEQRRREVGNILREHDLGATAPRRRTAGGSPAHSPGSQSASPAMRTPASWL